MLVAFFLVLIVLNIFLSTYLQVSGILVLHRLHRLFSDLFELLKLYIYVLLNLISLGQEHLPFPDVVDGFIVVRNKVTFDKRTVAHEEPFSATFRVLTNIVISQTGVLTLLSADVSFLNEGSVPVAQRR